MLGPASVAARDSVARKTGSVSRRLRRRLLLRFGAVAGVADGIATGGVKQRPARTYRNPRTGEMMEVGPSTTVGFRPGAGLKGDVG